MITADEWAGSFGDEWTERNLDVEGRGDFWNALMAEYKINSVLEVGCNAGANLKDLKIPAWGVDVNREALEMIPETIHAIHARATDLPFHTNSFDMVFTFGLLIHIPPEDLDTAMREIVRCARRYVFFGEYFSHHEEEVPYRDGVLWKRDYGKLYEDIGLKITEKGLLEGGPWGKGGVTWWLCQM
jgi:SAM-dependent methyltransferase